MRTTDGERRHDTFRHEATFYRGAAGFLSTAIPFIRDGVRDRQPVMVAVPPRRIDLLRESLGPDADDVRFVDMERLGSNPASIIPAWLRFVEEFCVDGRSVRGIGEPVWAGRRDVEIVESQLHEALLNTALDPDTALWLRCPYDVSTLDPDVLAAARHSHPALLDDDDIYRGSPDYWGAHLVDVLFSTDFDDPEISHPPMEFGRADYAAVRHEVATAAAAAGIGADRAADLALAAHEIASNSVRHGGGTGTLRIWTAEGALVCEVRDVGRVADPLVGRTWPSPTREGGRGVWLANQLCDLVQLRSGPGGTVVRLLSWLDA